MSVFSGTEYYDHRGSATGRISHNFKAEARKTQRKQIANLCEICVSVVKVD
jgi:hypothetical protein